MDQVALGVTAVLVELVKYGCRIVKMEEIGVA